MSDTALAAFLDLEPPTDDFRQAVLEGLREPQKRIPPKFFYDETGSRLFDRICELPEYYPTRSEVGILRDQGERLGALLPEGASVIEFGAGSAQKIRLLVDALRRPRCYVPLDISRRHLLASAESFARDHPELPTAAVCADFTLPVPLDEVVPEGPRIGFFPGSTIGNLAPEEAVSFLRSATVTLRPGGFLVVGVDLQKDPAVLVPAYDDAEGVTAAFNLNLLRRINRELGGTFELSGFRHRALYDPALGRIEMHLESLRAQAVRVAGERFAFAEGETIHTENSWKYEIEGFRALAERGGFRPALSLSDPDGLFSVHVLAVA